MSVLELHHVSKVRGRGRRAVRVLDGVSLAVDSGECLLLQGPSGSGKTTLLAVAAGLLRADRGEVVLAGRALGCEGPAVRRRLRAAHVGFVFQRANLLPGLDVRENVALAGLLSGLSRAEAGRRADELLDRLGLSGLASRPPAELSGGEEQRAAVARALVHRPALVLADEPTAMLDGAAGSVVAAQLRTLAQAHGAAVLVATHDPRLEAFATRRVRILDGRVQEDGRA